MFEEYFENPGSEWIPRSELSTRTKMNLAYLERHYGFTFDDQARRTRLGQTNSYLVFGTAPDGAEVVYERRGAQGARQTYVWVGGRRHLLKEFGGPMPIYFGVEGIVESLPGIKKLREKSLKAYRDWERRAGAFYEAKGEAITKDIESMSTEDLGEEERKKLRRILSVLYGEYTEEPPTIPERGERLLKYLTKEEKEEARRLIKEYRESYGV